MTRKEQIKSAYKLTGGHAGFNEWIRPGSRYERFEGEGLFLAVLYYLGLRRGEALGLKWGDFDFNEDQVHIQRDLDYACSVAQDGSLKTDAADRYVPIPPELKGKLLPNRGGADEYVFHTEKGKPLPHATFKRMWHRLMLAAACVVWREVKPGTSRPDDILKQIKVTLTPHYFRHNYVTMLYESGIDPLVAMKIVCHTDYQTTANIYTHIKEEMLKKATVDLEGVFKKLLLFGLDETSLMPHELILSKPAVLLNPICSYTCLFFALAAYKYVGVSVRNTFANVDGLFYILFLVTYHLLTGNAGFAARLFSPTMAIGLILILGVTIIYPSLKGPQEERQTPLAQESAGSSRAALKIGIALAIVSALFDGADSFVSSVLIGDSIVDSMEFIATNALVQVIITVFVWSCLWIRNKRIYNPFRRAEKYRFISQALSAAGDVLYVFALSGDALLSVVLWNVFPVLDILGARILMKEKLTRPQYLVLFALIIGAVLVSIS